MNIYKKSFGKAISLFLAYFLIATPLLSSCGGGGSGSSNGGEGRPPTNSMGSIQINTDPQDPLISIIKGKEHGDKLVIYGEKDSNGDPTKVEFVQYFNSEEEDPTIFHLDDQGRPVFITFPMGEYATLSYEGDMLYVTIDDNTGVNYMETFSLKNVSIPSIQNKEDVSHHKITQEAYKEIPKTLRSVHGKLTIYLTTKNQEQQEIHVGTLDKANITVTATNSDVDIIPSPKGNGIYTFTVPHRVADLKVLAKECNDFKTKTGLMFTVLGIFASIFGAIITKGTTLAAKLMGSGGGVLFGIAAGKVGIEALNCEDLIRKNLVDAGEGEQKVTFTVKAGGLSKSGSISYNIFDKSEFIFDDPTYPEGSFEIAMNFPIMAKFTHVWVNPRAPAVGSSYRLGYLAIIPPGGVIWYGISRLSETLELDESFNVDVWSVHNGPEFTVDKILGPYPGANYNAIDKVYLILLIPGGDGLYEAYDEYSIDIEFQSEKIESKCPEGIWQVRHEEHCKPGFFTSGQITIKSDGTWSKVGGGLCETGENSPWSLNGDLIILNAETTWEPVIITCDWSGVITDIDTNCSKMTGREYITIGGKQSTPNCWEAERIE
jgi:hypothetical protein